MYFVMKNCSLTICKNWRVRVWPVTWGLTLGFDRLKATPDRSALGAGCTTTLSSLALSRMSSRVFFLEDGSPVLVFLP